MGGNVFPITRRVDKKEYKELVEEVVTILKGMGVTHIHPSQNVGEKDTFGDVDVLVGSNFRFNKTNLKEAFNCPDFDYKYMNEYHILYKGVQVDLIPTNVTCFEIAKIFFDYNDLGNFIGRLSKHYRIFSFKPKGLYFKVYSEITNKATELGEILLSKDPEHIFKVLDLDYNRYKQGFDTYDDMFRFVTSSKCFFAGSFSDREFINGNNVKRNLKRKTVVMFIEWLKENYTEENHEFVEKDFEKIMEFAHTEFPKANIKSKVKVMFDKLERRKKHHAIFNGNIAMEVTGYTGKDLGKFIQYFNNNCKPFIDEEVFLALTPEGVVELIKDTQKGFRILQHLEDIVNGKC